MRRPRALLILLVLVAGPSGQREAAAQAPRTRQPIDFQPTPLGDDVLARIRDQDTREALARSFPMDLDWGLP